MQSDCSTSPHRPEQRRVRRQCFDGRCKPLLDVGMQIPHDGFGHGMSLVRPPFTRPRRNPQSPSQCLACSVATEARRIPVNRRMSKMATSRGRCLFRAASMSASIKLGVRTCFGGSTRWGGRFIPTGNRIDWQHLSFHQPGTKAGECRLSRPHTGHRQVSPGHTSIHSWIVLRLRSESLATFPYRLRTKVKNCSRFQRAVWTPPSVFPRCLSWY